MKVCIQIDSSFDDFLLKVGQMNNSSCGKICRLIVEHQLTFYLSRQTIPMFYPGVFADFKKMDLSGFKKPVEDLSLDVGDYEGLTCEEILRGKDKKEEIHGDDEIPGLDY